MFMVLRSVLADATVAVSTLNRGDTSISGLSSVSKFMQPRLCSSCGAVRNTPC